MRLLEAGNLACMCMGEVLQELEATPDRADGAVEFARRIFDGDARRVVDQLEELPLRSALVPARHVGKYDM